MCNEQSRGGSSERLTSRTGGQGSGCMEMPAELRELLNYSYSCSVKEVGLGRH